MTIRTDSYASVAEVVSFSRHLLDGQSTFNSTTRPTLTEVEKYIDRASAALNISLKGVGISIPITSTSNSTACLLCDDWVTVQASEYVDLTKRGEGYGGGENRTPLPGLYSRAADFVKTNLDGLIALGISQGRKKSDGLVFTGMDARGERNDPDDGDIEQPIFSRHQFDNGEQDSE